MEAISFMKFEVFKRI